MSSGPSDANAEGALIEDVWCAAYDLTRAIERAKDGHRGLCASDAQILREINNGLSSSGFKVVPR
jgi:hypothetical protein